MNLTIINPPWFFLNGMSYFPQNLGLRYLVSYLIGKDHDIAFIDALKEGRNNKQTRVVGGVSLMQIGLTYEDIVSKIPIESDFIALGVPFTFLAPIAKELTFIIKNSFKVPVITGGVFPSILPGKALEFSDYVVVGEGETAMASIMDGEEPRNIKGVHGQDFNNGLSVFLSNLDDAPVPYREDAFEDYLSMSSRGRLNTRTASIVTSRGCPFTCNFCSTHPTAGYKWRARSVENVLAELVLLQNRFGITHIEIEDDNFTLDPLRTSLLLEGIIKQNECKSAPLHFLVPNGLRIDTISNHQISLMKRAGFESLYLALESGDESILSLMNKKLSLDKVIKIAKTAAENDLPILYFLMIGYPGETRDRFLSSIAFCRKLKQIGPSSFTTFLARAYPGTALYSLCIDNGYFHPTDDQEVFLGTRFNITTDDFDATELRWRLKYANDVLNDGRKQRHIL